MPAKGGRKDLKVKTASDVQRQQRRTLIGIMLGIVVVFAGLVWADRTGVFSPAGGPACEGVQGAPSSPIHEHANLFVFLNSSTPYPFGQSKYQVQAGYLHFENGARDNNGAQIHIHLDYSSDRPTLRCLFDTLAWQVTSNSIRTDDGTVYRADATHTLTWEVNDAPAEDGANTPLIAERRYVVRYAYTGGPVPPADGNETGEGNATAEP